MNPIPKWLTDPDANNWPFHYQVGDRLESPTKNIQGTVRNAKYTGPKQPGPAWLAYYLNDGISSGSPTISKPITAKWPNSP